MSPVPKDSLILSTDSFASRTPAAFFRPRFTRLLIDALQQSRDIRAVMADLVSGRQGYAGLKWRLLKTLEARLAWRAVVGAERW